MQPWALVTPASRGIGMELARRLLLTTNVPVVATARGDPDQTKENLLSGLRDVKENRLHVLKLDVLGRVCSHRSGREQALTAIRRTDHPRRRRHSFRPFPEEGVLPPSFPLRSRSPLPREITLANRLRACPPNLPH